MTESLDWLAWLKDKGVDTEDLKSQFTLEWKNFEIRLSPSVLVKFTVRLGEDNQPIIKDGRISK